MCRGDWRRVPPPLQAKVWAAWRKLEAATTATEALARLKAYKATVAEAIAAVTERAA